MTTTAPPILPSCAGCRHPHTWHPLTMNPTGPRPCLGYNPNILYHALSTCCDCPDVVWEDRPIGARVDDPMPLNVDPANRRPTTHPLRAATQAEKNIARAWVARHRWTNPRDAEVEYEHALAILVFANARPPLKGRDPSRVKVVPGLIELREFPASDGPEVTP